MAILSKPHPLLLNKFKSRLYDVVVKGRLSLIIFWVCVLLGVEKPQIQQRNPDFSF